MNKQETVIVVVLFILLVAALLVPTWLNPQKPVPAADPPAASTNDMAEVTDDGPEKVEPAKFVEPEEEKRPEKIEEAVVQSRRVNESEQTATISNEEIELKVSSWGGGIVSAQLSEFPETLEEDSGPVILDFRSMPAFSFESFSGFSTNSDFELITNEGENVLTVTKRAESGLSFSRRIEIVDGYRVQITERFENTTKKTLKVPGHELMMGPMTMVKTKASTRGQVYLGIDTLSSSAGSEVVHWAKRGPRSSDKTEEANLAQRFQNDERQRASCRWVRPDMASPLPGAVEVTGRGATDWVAVKNKFFVQILSCNSTNQAPSFILNAYRKKPKLEDPENPKTWVDDAIVEKVSASLTFEEKVLDPGESLERVLDYYVGPKKFSIISTLGNEREEIMEFGSKLGWLSKFLLRVLNGINDVVGNYGVAIILLTIAVRLLFWPIMRKSTESMRRMQEIQPQLTELKAKFKDSPQKLQKETMALYKVHKVNPLGGCLPMLVQIPVFISLFVMLRSAVELRFAPFLWISDLSEPEGLLAGLLPIPLNPLPVVMAATMFWQQKLTPTSGDPQQQKMMSTMMTVFMLFLFYNMASGLLLYWTTGQLLAIVQLWLQKRKKPAPVPAAG